MTGLLEQESKQGYKESERGTIIQAKVRRTEEDQRKARATELRKQGAAWMKWDLSEQELTWKELWREGQFRISFCLRSMQGTLPSPANLQQWEFSEDTTVCRVERERP
uniref:Uncharacterized protein n=1 Tax=Magallana gigas TaxID=29159 RepID=A0A8W8I4L3_MAGGI